MPKKSTTEEFILKANEVHGNKYDYSKVVYFNTNTKVIIGCPIHGDFEQTPHNHLTGYKCITCGGTKKQTTEEFIRKAKIIHGNKYDYSKVIYVNNKTKVIIGCPIHGFFEQTPNNHLIGQGCSVCGIITTKQKLYSNKEEFILKANEVHGNRYDYSKVVYVNSSTKVIIRCPIHEIFEQTPNMHLTGNGCLECSIKRRSKLTTLNTEDFIKKAIEVHGNRYDYSRVIYINNKTKVIIGCKEHGEFKQRPSDHSNGSGCNRCSKQGYSQKAITWLNQIAEKENIYIQHAENEGEYQIPGTRYFADGYCSLNNIIYEFYGNRFHGNPNLFKEQDQCHPFTNESAGSLYTKTLEREQEIKNMGYNLITIWENELVHIKKSILNTKEFNNKEKE